MPNEISEEIFRLQAEFCKSLTSPKRLMIIHELQEGPKSVSELAKNLRLKQSSTSQHLAVLRTSGVITPERQGNTVYYSLTNPRIITACENVRAIIIEDLKRLNQLGEAL